MGPQHSLSNFIQTLTSNLSNVKRLVEKACHDSGRSLQDVHLIAVSKTWPVDHILPVVEQGHFLLGENKVQELTAKSPVMPDEIEWHFIGGLQRNKVRKVIQHSSWIHSVDSIRLLETINRVAHEEQRKPHIFIQVNIDSEDTKGGFELSAVLEAVTLAHQLTHVELAGLMCIPSPHPTPEQSRPAFKRLRELQDQMRELTGAGMPYLSMGMSHDYQVAIEEGATHIRVGSAIFGSRNYPT